MGCGCKGEISTDKLSTDNKPKQKTSKKISTYILKSLAFILMIAILPIINLFIIWFIFKTLILNKDVDIKPLLLAIGAKFNTKDDEDDDDDYGDDELEMVDVDDITNKNK